MKIGLTLLAIPFAFFALASQADPVADPVLQGASGIIAHLRAVTPGEIYRGGHPGDAGLKALAKAGVKTIVDLQGGDSDHSPNGGESEAGRAEEKKMAESVGMQFINVPLSSMKVDFDDQTQQIKQALNALSDPSNFPVYIHCFHGEDRTGVLVALYRTTYQDCTVDQAHEEMMDDGHSHFLFWIDVYLYDHFKEFLPLPGRSSKCPLN